MQINRITPAVRELASGLKFPEGPIALPDGPVILVEMRRQALSRVSAVAFRGMLAAYMKEVFPITRPRDPEARRPSKGK